ncbi:MAG: aminotransferase class V-fold PLP-dependent enzyme [Bacilli bacterium]
MIDYQKIAHDFPMLKRTINGKRLVFLDSASTTFKPQSVIDGVNEYLSECTSNSHRGDYQTAYEVDVRVDETRATVARFINAEKDEIVFTSGTSMSINLVAYGYGVKHLTAEDEILITQAEHASNVLPWFKVSEHTGAQVNYIPLDEAGRLTPENLKKVISHKTKIVAVAHVTNVMGFLIDIKEITRIAHEYGALVIVDGAQSVPHFKTDVKEWGVDFLSFSGHKMLGPTGIGVLYGRYELLQAMDPLMMGGGMSARFDMCGDVDLMLPPVKFEAGTLNLEGIFGLKKAVEYLEDLGMDAIVEHEEQLRAYAISELKKLDNVIIYNEKAEAGIITFNLKGVFAQDAATYFNAKGIAVRSGQHCAKILTDFLQTHATIRMSMYVYTTKEDIDLFVEACQKGGDFLDAYFD